MVDTLYLEITAGARNALIAISVLWCLFVVVLALRLRGRWCGPGLGLDDILSTVAFMLTTSTIGLNVTVFMAGVGHDFDKTSEAFPKLVNNLPFIMQITFAFTIVYIWALATLKLSQLALYLRVFAQELQWHVYIVGSTVIVWAVVFNFLFVFLCKPISQQWTVNRTGKCIDQILLLKMLILTNMITDLMIVALPVRSVWNLHMRKTEKFAVLSCFGLGLACVFISIARFILMYTIDLLSNLTGTSLTTFMLCTVELMLAGLCINIPTLRPFYLKWRTRYKESSSGSSERRSTPLSGSMLRRSKEPKPGLYTQWLELDRTNVTITHDDASSERKLTDSCTPQPQDVIHVSKNWEVTRQ